MPPTKTSLQSKTRPLWVIFGNLLIFKLYFEISQELNCVVKLVALSGNSEKLNQDMWHQEPDGVKLVKMSHTLTS